MEIRKGVLGGACIIKNDSRPVIESLKDMLFLGQVNQDEIAQVRLALEPTLAAKAAKKAGPKDIERCEEANRKLKTLFQMKDPMIQHDTAMHALIA